MIDEADRDGDGEVGADPETRGQRQRQVWEFLGTVQVNEEEFLRIMKKLRPRLGR